MSQKLILFTVKYLFGGCYGVLTGRKSTYSERSSLEPVRSSRAYSLRLSVFCLIVALLVFIKFQRLCATFRYIYSQIDVLV